jgi:DNA-binding transcriptional MocR family regulator
MAQIAGRTAREIASSVESQIRKGGLGAGDRLPPIRGLAHELGVSPMTVATAYRELGRRGLVSGAGRLGTRVSDRPPVTLPAMPEIPEGVRDLITGNPDPELLPPLDSGLATLDTTPRLYRPDAALPALGELARKQFAADGIDVPALAVVAGAMDAIERVLGAHLRPGDSVAVEDPGYIRVFDLLRSAGLGLVPVAVDDLGMVPDGLGRALARGAGAVILTPRAQNPRGSAFDIRRARELRAALSEHPDVLVLEDDHAGAIAGAPALTVCGGATHWAIARSVSKTLGPDLRLAVVAGDAETIARVGGRQMLGTGWVSHVLQQLVAELWSDPATTKLVAGATETYARRREAMIAALEAHGIGAHGRTGLHVWVPVPQETAVVTSLLVRGWAVMPGERWRLETPPAIRISTASLKPDDAELLAADLAETLAGRVGTFTA